MLRILFLAHRLPYPPDRGDRIRSYHALRHLAQRHRVHLAAVTDGPPAPAHLEPLRALCESVDVAPLPGALRWAAAAAGLATRTPLTLPLFHSPALGARVARSLAEGAFDLVYIYGSAMAPYVLANRGTPRVIDFVDADSQKWLDYAAASAWPLRALYWREGRLLRRHERRVAAACAHALVASEREAEILRRVAPETPITTISNGVSLAGPAAGERRPDTLVFTGVMDYRPNVDAVTWLVREVLPLVRARGMDARLAIVGQRPERRVRRLGKEPGVTVTGWVPDVTPYLRSATLFVAPLRIARGIQNKVLEAMAAGLPVVTTSAGRDGLGAVPGRDLLVADTPGHFADHIVSLLADPGRREALGRAAEAFVREHHRWETHLEHMERILLDVVRAHRAASVRATA